MRFPRIDLLFVLALVAGLVHFLAGRFGMPSPYDVLSKGVCVGLLALWALLQARSADGWLIAAVLAAGATGDVLIETHGLIVGAVAFLAGHLLAITLYLRNRAAPLWLVAAAPVGFAAWWLSGDLGASIYAIGLGAMAGVATGNRFPRGVGLGAWLFVASDLLIFARIGPLAGSALPAMLIWPLYVAGQALIGWGVVTTLRSEVR